MKILLLFLVVIGGSFLLGYFIHPILILLYLIALGVWADRSWHAQRDYDNLMKVLAGQEMPEEYEPYPWENKL